MESATPNTRASAASAGSRYYVTGVPCVNGHLAKRYTSNGACERCQKEANGRFARMSRQATIARAKGGPYIIVRGQQDHLAAVRAYAKAFGDTLEIIEPPAPRAPATPTDERPATLAIPQMLANGDVVWPPGTWFDTEGKAWAA